MEHKRIFGSLDPFAEPGPALGRRVANEQFLRFLLASGAFDAYHFFVSDAVQRKHLQEWLHARFPGLLEEGTVRIPHRLDLSRSLVETRYHCFHQSDCITHQPHLARVRNLLAPEPFPVTGLIHSLSYASYPESFLAHIWPGATARDAIVATSRAGADAVRGFFEMLGEAYFPGAGTARPGIERIPLGVDTEVFRPPSAGERDQARQGQDWEKDRVVVLVFGRIQHHSKMDLLPVLRAFQRVFQRGRVARGNVHLALAGWVGKQDHFPGTLRELAANMGLSLSIHARPDDDERLALYQSADVFLSASDNPQETFGLTLLEAGAMGLPVVASDYDGYRDLVEHGVTGLLVPTIGPERTNRINALSRVLFDNQYHLLLAQQTVVEVPALGEALERLVLDAELRRDMGRAARIRVEEAFSWPGIIERYTDLWDELWRRDVDPTGLRNAAHPLHLDYGRIFRGYASRVASGEDRLVWSPAGRALYRGQEHPLIYAGVDFFVRAEAVRTLVFLARKPAAAADLARRLAREIGESEESAWNTVLWALKHDYLERAS